MTGGNPLGMAAGVALFEGLYSAAEGKPASVVVRDAVVSGALAYVGGRAATSALSVPLYRMIGYAEAGAIEQGGRFVGSPCATALLGEEATRVFLQQALPVMREFAAKHPSVYEYIAEARVWRWNLHKVLEAGLPDVVRPSNPLPTYTVPVDVLNRYLIRPVRVSRLR